jgi:hypothetical protein
MDTVLEHTEPIKPLPQRGFIRVARLLRINTFWQVWLF